MSAAFDSRRFLVPTSRQSRPKASYKSDCCCSPNDERPATLIVRKTITLRRTKLVTVTGRKQAARGLVSEFEREAGHGPPLDSLSHDSSPDLVSSLHDRALARHLCPVCPAGVVLGKTSGGSNVKWCCKRRQTIRRTRTVKKTRTIRKTVTATIVGKLRLLYWPSRSPPDQLSFSHSFDF